MKNSEMREILDSSIRDGFVNARGSVRICNTLTGVFKKDISEIKMRDVCRKTRWELLKYRNVGRHTITDIEDSLECYGLRLGMTEAQLSEFDQPDKVYEYPSLEQAVGLTLDGNNQKARMIETDKEIIIIIRK